MGIHIDPMSEAATQDCMANAARHFAANSRWRIVKWWYERKAHKYEESADIWRGLAWREQQAKEQFFRDHPLDASPPPPLAGEDHGKVVKSG